MKFGLLGPLQARAGAASVDVGPQKRRAILAVLLLDLGQPPMLEVGVLVNLGETLASLGLLAEAAADLGRALAIIRADGGEPMAEEFCLRMLSPLQWARGDRAAAMESARSAAGLATAGGHHGALGYAHLLCAGYYRQLGRNAEALGFLAQAAQAWRIASDAKCEWLRLIELGAVQSALGQHAQALATLHEALAGARDTRLPSVELEAALGLADACRSSENLALARRYGRSALAIAGELDQPPATVRAHDGLAATLLAMGDSDQALALWDRALADHGSKELQLIADIADRAARLRQAQAAASAPA